MAKKKIDDGKKLVCRNKRARFDYELEDRYEAGLVLTGTEVKSLREGRANINDSYAKLDRGEVWLISAHISPYSFARYDNHDPERKRKLLLTGKEIKKLHGKMNEKGQSLIPLAVYFNERGLAKVELALGKGKKSYDKRQDMKKKDAEREMARAVKRRGRE